MSRVDSVKIAKIKAKEAGLSLKGSVVASDAFFLSQMQLNISLKLEQPQ